MRDAWPRSAAPLALAALPGAPSCAAFRTRLVAAEWGLGALAVAAEQVARDLVAGGDDRGVVSGNRAQRPADRAAGGHVP